MLPLQRLTQLLLILGLLSTEASWVHGQQKIGTRQIHLDFHTSEYLPDVGQRFSKEQFQSALKAAHVNAINIFAKGHHSWSYYPTKVGHMHPNLDFDLLGAQIEACHEIGVLCPIYFTFGWSHTDAVRHPEWCARNPDGSLLTTGPYDESADPDTPKPSFHWINMCVNTPYRLEDAEHPGVIRHGNVIFIAHKLDEMYYKHGARLHRDMFNNALKLLNKRPMVESELPSTGRISLLHQAAHNRYVVHLLYGPPITRGACEVIEDLPMLYNVPVTVDLPVDVKKAVLVPDMRELPISRREGKLSVTVPQFSCHCAISFEYE